MLVAPASEDVIDEGTDEEDKYDTDELHAHIRPRSWTITPRT